MRTVLAVVMILMTLATPALAQTRAFVTADVFADLKRFSGDPSTNVLDGDAAGGGVRVGTFLTPQWSVELGVDLGRSTTALLDTPTTAIKGAPPPLRQTRTVNRLTATSVVVAFHTSGARVQLGYIGGLTLLHVVRRTDTLVGGVAQKTRVRDMIDNVPAATLGMEARIAVGKHFGVVPEVRALAFSLSGTGPSGFAIRPGVAARWNF